MGMTISIKGVLNKDDPEYIKHYRVAKACSFANISILPYETSDYFGFGRDNDLWSMSEIDELMERELDIEVHQEPDGETHRIKVSDIPKDIEFIELYLGC